MSENQSRDILRYVTPDGALAFLIVRESGDVSLGFDGYPSHTHGDILASLTGKPIGGKLAIAIAEVEARVRDVWACELPVEPDKYRPENETITFRLWDGTIVGVDGPGPQA
jgi:hypothetical protein